MLNKPIDFQEVFCFYNDKFKPLYSEVEAGGRLSQEMMFEVIAAFDHMSRHWVYGETEQAVVDRVCGHLKRGCFDGFKLIAARIADQYTELKKVDTSLIDNGEFDKDFKAAWFEIRDGTKQARLAEGDSIEDWHRAFDIWEPVYEKCTDFEQKFFRSPKIEWAKTKTRLRKWRDRWEMCVITFLIGIIAALVVQGVGKMLLNIFGS